MMRKVATLALVAALISCDGGAIDGEPATGSDGSLPPPFPDALISPDGQGGLPEECGDQTIPISVEKKNDVPDLFLVVDKSGSMGSTMIPFDFFGPTRWSVMQKTLGSLVDTFKGSIRFGLSLYPGNMTCGPGAIDVSLQADNEETIKQRLALFPVGGTPTHATLAAVGDYLATVPPVPGGRYVLLATDGEPNCRSELEPKQETLAETLAEVEKLAAAGYKVIILGFGDVVVDATAHLDALAAAGGFPNPSGPHKFYPATSEQELKDALFTIGEVIKPPPCTYALDSAPPDLEKVTVTFDGQPVARSTQQTDGWDYTDGAAEITFFGAACDKLQSGAVKQVQLRYGCKGPQID